MARGWTSFLAIAVAIAALAAVLPATPTIAQAADDPPAVATPGALDTAAVEQWADQVFGKMLAEYRFSSLAIAVTEGDKVILAKGYGYGDWAAKSPVEPEKSQFRIASLTKTFTATAIAQLLERGKIASLDDPANKYLKRVQLQKAFGEDITLWDLLTHRAGYENYPIDRGVPSPQVPATAAKINESTPQIVRKRDTVSVYCNFCVAILGTVVEDITGQTLQDYFQENIFGPVGMTHTLLSYSPKPTPDLVTQFAFKTNASPMALSYYPEPSYMSPAGGINATAADMAAYMITHIAAGRGAAPAILKPATFDLMHRQHTGNHPATSGFGMAFFTYDYNGEPVIEHYGSLGYRDLMVMMLDRKIGVIVMAAGGGGPPGARGQDQVVDTGAAMAQIAGKVERQLSQSGMRALVLEHFLGPLQVPATPLQVDLSKYTGLYRSIGRTESLVQSLPNLLHAAVLTVKDSGDGGLMIGDRSVYRASEANVFTLDHPLDLEAPFGVSNRYVFTLDDAGRARQIFGHVNAGGYVRAAGLDDPDVLRLSLLTALAVGLTGMFAAFWGSAGAWPKVVKISATALGFTLLGGVAYSIASGAVAGGTDERIVPLVALANLAAALTALLIFGVIKLLLAPAESRISTGLRIHLTAVALAALALVFILNRANFIGYHL